MHGGVIQKTRVSERLFGNYGKVYAIFFALVALHSLVAFAISPRTVSEFIRPAHFLTIILLGIFPVLFFTLYTAVRFTVRRTPQPTRALLRVLYRNRTWLLRSCILFAISWPSHQAFIALKVAIPRLVPYYADPWLADLDNLLFLGNDPWVFTHALFGSYTGLIDTIYYQWFTVVMWIHIWASFSRNPRFQIQATFAHMLTWLVLGNIFAISLSSVGPIYYEHFYADDRFSPLLGRLDPDLNTMEVRAYLIGKYGMESFGSGISAAPSLHVALTVLIYMMIRDRFTARHWLAYLALGYIAVIFIGSIHLAWHYALDGIISIIAVPFIYRFAGQLTERYSSVFVARRVSGTQPQTM